MNRRLYSTWRLISATAGHARTTSIRQSIDESTPVMDASLMGTSFGEDACIATDRLLAVADGVGGWSVTSRAQPALYARLLIHHLATENTMQPIDLYSARKFMEKSHLSLPKELVGSACMALAVLNPELGKLSIASLGDCTIAIYRRRHLVFRTEEQQHAFNCPKQLSSTLHRRSDSAQDALITEFHVRYGDMIVVGSDGVFDNLYDEEMVPLLKQHGLDMPKIRDTWTEEPAAVTLEQVHACASNVARLAYEASQDRRRSGPFAQRALQEGLMYEGGKQDDISVAVAFVTVA